MGNHEGNERSDVGSSPYRWKDYMAPARTIDVSGVFFFDGSSSRRDTRSTRTGGHTAAIFPLQIQQLAHNVRHDTADDLGPLV